MEGWLEKKGEGGIFGWKKRYFRLLGKQLHYYKSPNDNSSVGFIPVEEIQTVHPTLHDKGKDGFHFQVNTSVKSYYLFTPSEEQFNYWLMGLVKLIKELGSDKKFFEPPPSSTASSQEKDHRHIQTMIMNNPMVNNNQRKQRSPTIVPSSNAPMFPIQYPTKPIPTPNSSLSSSDPPNLSSWGGVKGESQMNENIINEQNQNTNININTTQSRDLLTSTIQSPPSPHIPRPLPAPPSNSVQSKESSTSSPTLHIASIKLLQPLPEISINQPLSTASEENKEGNQDDPSIDLYASSDSDDDDDNFDYYLDDFEDEDKELGDGNDQKQEKIDQNIIKEETNLGTEEDQTEKVSLAMKRTSRYLNRINSSMKSNTSSFWEKSKIGNNNPSQATPRSEFLSLVRRRQSIGNNLVDKRSRHRMKCAVEILETEESYVGNMELVVNHYMSSLTQSKDKRILTNLPIIFSNIETILPVNQQLLSLLRSRISAFLSTDHQPESNEELILGDIFTKMCPDLKLYSSYGTNYEIAITTYHRELKDKEFPLFKELIDRLDEETKNTQLHHLLIMPIQRIPRYNLLLSELIKYTDPSHSDYQNLITALENMKEVANHINNSVKVSRPDRKLELLQDRFDIINLLTPQRQLIKEGVVNVKNKKGKMGKRQILLCNDILVHVARSRVKRGNEFIKPENNWPISLLWPVDLSVSSISPLVQLNQSSKEGKSEKEGGERASTIHNSNQQLKIIGPVLRPLIIDFDSVEEANEWKNTLKKVIADHLASLPPPPFPPFDPSHPKFSSAIAPSSGQFRYGEFTFPDQSHYTGYWLDGFKHGKGIYTNGENKYEGYFIKNHLEGEGKLTMANGDEITGQFHLSSLSSLSLQIQIPSPSPHSKHPHPSPVTQPNNKINHNNNNNSSSESKEVFKTQKGDSFTGLWKANLKCDHGTMLYHNGDKYTGSWLNDLPHGKGTMYYKSKMSYTGEWIKGHRHGQGVMDYGNGSTYDGAWLNGKKHGFGTLVLPDGSYYEGEFSHNEYDGKGEMVYKNGRKYSGGWKAGKRSGFGSFSSAVGFIQVYEGEWYNDAFNGKGSITFDNNDKYEGYFKDFKMHGAGIYTLHNAKLNSKIVLEGKWNNGIRDGKFIIKFENQTMVGYTRDNAILISGSQTELPLPSSPPYFDIDLS